MAGALKRPRLRPDVTIVEQVYRGEQSYIVKEQATHKYFRFKLLEVLVMQHFDGERSCADVAAELAEQGMPLKPAAVEAFARKLGQMGLLERTVAERSVLLLERLRAERTRRVKRTHYQGSLLRLRFPLGDPDPLMARLMPHLGFFFSRPFLAVSVVFFVAYGAVVSRHWDVVQATLARISSPTTWTLGFLVTMWCTVMVVVLVHESGHAFTCKYFGGEVHEVGAMLIYFQPAFYANVNDAWTFPELRSRLWVTAAGTWVQMVLAGIAALVWWAAEPGTLVAEVAIIAMVFGGITTVLFNANPLIPLDGYYALSDWLQIPNLRQRAFQYLGWYLKRHLLRLNVPEPEADERERRIFLAYGALAVAYLASILTTIALAAFGWFSRTMGALGVAAFLFLAWPRLKRMGRGFGQAVVTAVKEHRTAWRSGRFWRGAGISGFLLLIVAVAVPWPIRVGGTFTAAAPLEVTLTAREEGIIWRVVAPEGARVPAGAPVVVLRNFALEDRALAARLAADSLEERLRAARADGDAAEIRRLETAREAAQGNLAALASRLATLTLRSPVAALIASPRLEEGLGRMVEAGDSVAFLLGNPDTVQLRIRLERAGAGLVRAGQVVRLLALVGAGASRRAAIASVAASGAAGDRGLEARVLLAQDATWRPGVRGEARITVRRSNLAGAVWWMLRKRVRNDLLL